MATYTPSKIAEQSNKFGEKLIELDARQKETKNSFKTCKNKVTNTNRVTKTNKDVSESDLELLLEANENLDNNSNSSNTLPKTQAQSKALIIETTKMKTHLLNQLRAKEKAIRERNTKKHRTEVEERRQNLANPPPEYVPNKACIPCSSTNNFHSRLTTVRHRIGHYSTRQKE